MGNLREHEVHSALAVNLNFIPGEVHYAALGSGDQYGFLRDNRRIPASRLHMTIPDAFDAAGRLDNSNNVVVLTPDAHSQAANIAWSKNLTHLVGMGPGLTIGNRCRITQSADFAACLTVSGDGNLFKNFSIEHGRGNAANLNALSLTGNYNRFENIHFNGPFHATEADTAGYGTIDITGGVQNVFKNCVIGARGFTRGVANSLLRLGAGAFGNQFEDCTFISYGDEATPYFIEVLVGLATEYSIFKNCQFIHWSAGWATSLTLAVNMAAAADDHFLIFDSRCMFHGVTDVVAANREATCIVGTVPYTAAATENLLSATVDHTA